MRTIWHSLGLFDVCQLVVPTHRHTHENLLIIFSLHSNEEKTAVSSIWCYLCWHGLATAAHFIETTELKTIDSLKMFDLRLNEREWENWRLKWDEIEKKGLDKMLRVWDMGNANTRKMNRIIENGSNAVTYWNIKMLKLFWKMRENCDK